MLMNADPRPVYVAGLERSGTSLMFALLASHPNIAMTRRTNLWKHVYERYGDLRDPANLTRCLDAMRRYKRLVVLSVDFGRLRGDFEAGEPTYPRLFALLEQQVADRLGKGRWGDKSLDTERWADPILAAYPGARILHMLRDPRDRYASASTRWHGRRGGVGAGTAEWLSSARLATRNLGRHPDRYLVVRYESLVTEPERMVREICAFIDEPFAPEMLSMDGSGRFKQQGGNSSYGRGDPGRISTGSIGRFREVLAPADVAFIQWFAGREMDAHAYPADPVDLDRSARLAYALRDVPLGAASALAWRAREIVHDRRGRPIPSYRFVDAPAEAA
jgi:hypothetical protein